MTEEANRILHSPYAIFDGEECTADAVNETVTNEELSYLLRNNFIGETEQRIIELIKKHQILNIRQLSDLLEILFDTNNTEKTESSVKKLFRKEFLKRYSIRRIDSKTVRYVYTLGKHADVVTGTDKINLIQELSVGKAKSILAANQLVISTLRDNANAVFSYEGRTLSEGNSLLCLHITIEDRKICAIIIRKNANWENSLKDSLDDVIKEAENNRVIIVCEDIEQVEQVRNLISSCNCNVLFDRQLHMKSLRDCLG